MKNKKKRATRKKRVAPKAVVATTAIVPAARPIVVQAGRKRELTLDEIELLKNTIAKGASENEFKLFLWVCTKHRLDPLTRQIHCIMRYTKKHHQDEKGIWVGGQQMTIQMGIDGYRALAARSHKDYGGCDEPEFEFGTDCVPGNTKKKLPTKATIRLWRKGFDHATVGVAYWDEYAPDLDGENGFFWKKMPKGQLAKCAEALAIRKAYPDLSDIYVNEEMHQAEEHTPEGRLIVQENAYLAGGSTAAATAVAEKKLADNKAGKPIYQPEAAKAAPKAEATTTITVEHVDPNENTKQKTPAPAPSKSEASYKEKAAASVKEKLVEYYPSMLGDMNIVIFIESPALAVMVEEGGKAFTAMSEKLKKRYMVDDPLYGDQMKACLSSLGFLHRRIKEPGSFTPSTVDAAGVVEAKLPPEARTTTTSEPVAAKEVAKDAATTICGKIESVRPRAPNKPMWVQVGGVGCTCWHKHLNVGERDIQDVFKEAIGKQATFSITTTNKGDKTYREIKAILRLGNREYDQHGPVRTREDIGQSSLY